MMEGTLERSEEARKIFEINEIDFSQKKKTANIQRTRLEERRRWDQHSEVQKGVTFAQKMKEGSTAQQEDQRLGPVIAIVLQRSDNSRRNWSSSSEYRNQQKKNLHGSSL